MFGEHDTTTPAMAAMIAARITTRRRPSRSHMAMDDGRVGVWGTDLRYLLTDLIAGPERRGWRVVELAEALERAGFELQGRPTKVVSDALRTEIQRGRVVRVGWGRYEMGHIPGGTRRRIRARSRAARDAVRSDW
ncbi:MAG: hypothetical protein OSA99_09830 [Acidimicrobiales bacterium]|nr:hypothetical protein [Acidimicrobiales bacterium]